MLNSLVIERAVNFKLKYMREIKFRAWDKEKKEWSKMISGKVEYPSVITKVQPIEANNHLEIMQFTGLTDKNGKEIYEGDVIVVANGLIGAGGKEKLVVEWKHDGYPGLMHPKKMVVIGNIYEDKDLFKYNINEFIHLV